MGLFSKIKEGLKKTRNAFMGPIDSMLKSSKVIDEDLFEELEDSYKAFIKGLKDEA